MAYSHTRKPLPDFPLPPPDDTADRIAYVEELMRTLQWERGRTGPALAKAWGFSLHAVERWASEAWRRVKADDDDPDHVVRTRMKITTALEYVIDGAIEEIERGAVMSKGEDRNGEPIVVTINPNDARRSIIAAGKTWAEIDGALAPQRVKIETAPAALSADELRAEAIKAARVLAEEDPSFLPELLVAGAEEKGGDE
jgi:hypothetical protein